MSHFASNGFGIPGGIDCDDFRRLREEGGASAEGCVFRVISCPSFVPCPLGLTYTQYSTCLLEKLEVYKAHGWKDEGFESEHEKVCIDWINRKPDRSLEAVLENNPDLRHRIESATPTESWATTRQAQQDQDRRRGKYI